MSSVCMCVFVLTVFCVVGEFSPELIFVIGIYNADYASSSNIVYFFFFFQFAYYVKACVFQLMNEEYSIIYAAYV